MRDQGGDLDLYRAFDVGITGQQLYDASRRLDVLVRSGRAPGVAEWFGTFDGQTVVGWYEGRPSTSDSSHLWHLHGGVWNEAADDAALMRLLYQTITGTAPVSPQRKDDDMPTFIIQPADQGGIALAWPCDRAGGWVFTNILPPGASVSAPAAVDALIAAGCVDARGWNVPSFDGYIPLSEVTGGGPGGGPSLAQIETVVDRQLDQQARAGADQD